MGQKNKENIFKQNRESDYFMSVEVQKIIN